MATEAKSFESEKEQADRLLAEMERPSWVKRITTDLGTDHSGEEALFVSVHLAKNAGRNRKEIKRISDYSQRVQILLMGNGITLFPYVNLKEAA